MHNDCILPHFGECLSNYLLSLHWHYRLLLRPLLLIHILFPFALHDFLQSLHHLPVEIRFLLLGQILRPRLEYLLFLILLLLLLLHYNIGIKIIMVIFEMYV